MCISVDTRGVCKPNKSVNAESVDVGLCDSQLYYVKAEAKPVPYMALNGQSRTPAITCQRWSKWEKL